MGDSEDSFVQINSFSVHPVNGNVEYIIHVGKNGHVVKRRFREFRQLREDLSLNWPDSPDLPSRFFSTAPNVRLPQLNHFLVEVCDALGPRPPKPLLDFLEMDEATFVSTRVACSASIAAVSKVNVDVGFPKCPEEFQSEIERVINEVMEIKHAQDGVKGWKLIGQRPPFIWMARADDPALGYKQCRVAFGELKRCPPRTVHDLILDNDACKQMEPKLDSIRDVAKLDEQTIAQYFIMKSIMFMPPRDVIMIRHWRVLPNGTILHAEFSLAEYLGVPSPESEGRVRAKLTVGGLIIEPVLGDPTACKIWRVNDMDPMLGDAIPAYARAKMNEFTASMLSNNMFSLEKLVSKCNLTKELAKGPLVNWNGTIGAGSFLGELQPTISTGPITKREEMSKVNLVAQEIAPYIVGFALGFFAALVTLVTSNN